MVLLVLIWLENIFNNMSYSTVRFRVSGLGCRAWVWGFRFEDLEPPKFESLSSRSLTLGPEFTGIGHYGAWCLEGFQIRSGVVGGDCQGIKGHSLCFSV